MKNIALLLCLFLMLPAFVFSYPKEVEELYVVLYSSPKSSINIASINAAIYKLENLDGSSIQKQTYSNIAETIRVQLDRKPKKDKSSKFKNLQNIIDSQESYFSSNDSDYLVSIANLIMAAIEYASLTNLIEYSKKAVSLYEATLKINPNHFEALLGYGISRGYQPSMFGGGVDKSLPLFERALSNAKTNVQKYQIYIWISQAYFEKKDYDNYNKYFNLAQAIYPNGYYNAVLKEANSKNKSIFDIPITSID